MSRRQVSLAANDNRIEPEIRVERMDSPPLSVAEVEIFDALISNIAELTAANDNERAPKEKKR